MNIFDLLNSLLQSIVTGGTGGVIAIFIGIIGLLIWDRKKLLESIDKKDERIEKILDDYHKGTITTVEAINSLNIVLAEIKGKL